MWVYKQPTEIIFGVGAIRSLRDVTARFGARPVLVTDSALAGLDMISRALAELGPGAVLFSEVEPNPTVACVDKLAALIRDSSCSVAVAFGGGSTLDCAKAACAVAVQGRSIRCYHSEGEAFDTRRVALVAVPTTAGTGSEVTPIAVLDDAERGFKAPLAHECLYPEVALIDPELTLSMPRFVTACTGLDALAHAVEGYWSKNHQPICDVLALEAAALIVENLPRVLGDGTDIEARSAMCRAALLAGMAFQIPKNAAVHACSYPLSNKYHLSHGAACAMTLDHFMRFNSDAMAERGATLARAAGFADLNRFADAIAELKAIAGLPSKLSEVGIDESVLDDLVESSLHPIMANNPREVTPAELKSLYARIL